jgi:hypothetical protein
MGKMGNYCKAYPVERFREFSGWSENVENWRKEKKEVDGKEVEVTREPRENDFYYLQENYVVTDGIFIDENIIFDSVTDEWKDFCVNTLKFEPPVYEPVVKKAEPAKTESSLASSN